jgi:hypothetical protein
VASASRGLRRFLYAQPAFICAGEGTADAVVVDLRLQVLDLRLIGEAERDRTEEAVLPLADRIGDILHLAA